MLCRQGDTGRLMISGDALEGLLQKLGGPPRLVVLTVDEFRAAVPRMSCFAVSCYPDLYEGQHFGMAAWADIERDPILYIAWEWVEVYSNAVGMRDPTAVSTNMTLIDHLGRQVSRIKRQIELTSAVHGWGWWSEVDPARLCCRPAGALPG